METPPPPPPPRPPRGPAPLDRDATARPADAFSLGKMREAMDTRVTQAKADLQRALASTRESLATPTSSSETSNGGPYPTINAFTELARRVPDTVAKLAPDDNVLLSRVRTAAAQRVGGMRRSSTADQLASGDHFFGADAGADADGGGGAGGAANDARVSGGEVKGDAVAAPGTLPRPQMPVMPSPPTLPEWDIFKSLKTSATSASSGGGRSGPMSDATFGRPRRRSGSNGNGGGGGDSNASSRRSTSPSRREDELSQPGDFGVATAAPTRKAFAMPDVKPPTEWLSDIHDAGSTAVQEWLEKAKEKAKDGEGKIGVMPGMKFKFGPPGGVGAGWKKADEAASGADVDAAPGAAAESPITPGKEPKSSSSSRFGRTSSMTSMSSRDGTENDPGEETELLDASVEISPSSADERRTKRTSSDVAVMPRADEERRAAAAAAVSRGASSKKGQTGGPGDGVASKQKSLKDPGRSIAIVTTAALPWMTGTAVNPLLRAAYLARRGLHDVTLVIPWLAPSEQKIIHPSIVFDSPEEQSAYVRKWVKERCGFEPSNLKMDFYPGRYHTDKYSILPVGDVSEYITDKSHDVAVLEEPEHLNWYNSGERWSDKFQHVVGIVHTNYLEYAKMEAHGNVKEKALRLVNSWVSRLHCHKIIKLSDAVQEFPRSETVNVHGVSEVFLEVGKRKATAAAAAMAAQNDPDSAAATSAGRAVSNVLRSKRRAAKERKEKARADAARGRGADGTAATEPAGTPATTPAEPPTPERVTPSNEVFTKGCYFLGKVVWGKGFHELLERVEAHNTSADGAAYPLELDVYGNGEDFHSVTQTSAEKNLPLTFHGRADHASDAMHDYKVFVNPSLSDVVATTTAEALAMGKYVICASHPSNEFFSSFPNCLTYDSPEEFSKCVKKALSTDPTPLSSRDRYRLSWEAATDRFLDAAELGEEQVSGPGTSRTGKAGETLVHALHSNMLRREKFRRAAGAGANTMTPPERLDGTWEPEQFTEKTVFSAGEKKDITRK